MKLLFAIGFQYIFNSKPNDNMLGSHCGMLANVQLLCK